MTGELLTELLQSMALLSVFLLIGMFLRAKVKVFQKTFLPASVIGGFLLLILGPIVLNIIPIPEDWLNTYSLIPGVLIIPIVASVPLGLKSGDGEGGLAKPIIPLFFIMSLVTTLQVVIGFATNLIFNYFGYELYDSFGWELTIGFAGGHGTAGLLGNMLQSMNIPYWKTAQGVAITTATFGIIGGIIFGMTIINWGARKGYTSILQKPSDIPENMKVGYEKDINKQESIGRETTISSSIDTVAFHLAIILTVSGMAYLLLAGIKKIGIPGLDSISIWAYAILLMFIVWRIMCKLEIDFLVDGKVKAKISGVFTEYAVIAAIASLPLEAVLVYIVPIIFMVLIGFIVTTFSSIYFSKKYLPDQWFEHMIASFGMSTGVFLTGILLLRVCDPDMESPVLGNYSLAYMIHSIFSFILMPIFLNIVTTHGAAGMLIASILVSLIYFVGTIISSKTIYGKIDKEMNV
ncbi:MAG: glutamate:sodium symporter [Tissierellia bacterium]|nr:glutamate:sodium symporter [Tissierellia bacterium]